MNPTPGESVRPVEIEGWPTLDGRPVVPNDFPEISSRALDQWKVFARQIRGQFSIIVRTPDTSFALTDLTGTYPVFREESSNRLEGSIHRFTSGSRRALSSEGICNYAAFDTGGFVRTPLAGIVPLGGGSIFISEGRSVTISNWVNWADWAAASQTGVAPVEQLIERLQEEFKEIIAAWAKLQLPGNDQVGLLLSGGTDSALLAALLKPLLGDRLLCITQDFFSGRYSERAAATETARLLKVPITVALRGRNDYYQAFRELNSSTQDSITPGTQANNLLSLAHYADQLGIKTLITGEHADSLFLGLGHFFHGFPQGLREYQDVTTRMTREERLDRVVERIRPATPLVLDILKALDISAKDYTRWQVEAVAKRRGQLEPLAQDLAFTRLQQLDAQMDRGLGWRELCLPSMRALPGCRILCPFYDPDVIRFALRLPINLIYRDGNTKYFLRRMLKDLSGIERPKQPAASAPVRAWRLVPNLQEYDGISEQLRHVYLGLLGNNLLKSGARCTDLAKVAALGAWMKSHQISA